MGEKIREHIRSNVWGMAAMFVALSGTAYAADTVGSSDIIDESILSQDIKNGDVKTPDLAQNSVGTGRIIDGGVQTADVLDETLLGSDIAEGAIGSNEVYNNSLGLVDLGIDSVAYSELSPAAFNGEIAETGRAFGIADNSIQTNEVSDNSLTGSDIQQNSLSGSDINEASLTPSIHAVAASSSDSSDGPLISSHNFTNPTTVITDEIGAGTWIVFGEVGIRNDDTNPTIVHCGIWTDETLREDVAEGLGEVPNYSVDRAILPLTAAFTTSSGGTLRLACSNAGLGDDGELRPRSANLVAIPVVSLG